MMVRCEGGPLDEALVSPELGDSWPAAVLVNYGSRLNEEGNYGHVLGSYKLETRPCCGRCETSVFVYVWQGVGS